MGFIAPTPPPVDVEEWKKLPHLSRLKPLAQDWAINGFGTPNAVYLLYLVKLVIFTVASFAVISATTPGLGGLGDVGDWWTEPIVFQKLVVWTLLWEIIGLGCGSMPLTFRFLPPIGGILYWLRPGTVRLPPWPDHVPFTAGSRRSIVDVALYAGVLISGGYLLLSDGESVAGLAGRLDPTAIAVTLGLLGVLGLRDKVSFLASRVEVYGFLLLVFLFPLSNFIVASQIVLRLHLARSGLLQAQPSLPVRGLGDDLQHAVEPLAHGQGEALPRPSRRPDPVATRRLRRPQRDRDRVHPADPAAAHQRRLDRHPRGDRNDHLPHPHHLDVPARRAARVEPVHDLRPALPLRALRRRALLDARRSAPDRRPAGSRRGHPDRRQPLPREDLLPARHALLRRQLGHQPVALREVVGRRGEARPRRVQVGADRRRAADQRL